MSKKNDEPKETEEVIDSIDAMLRQVDLESLPGVKTGTREGYTAGTIFGMKGIRIFETAKLLAPKSTILNLTPDKVKRKLKPEEIEARGKQKVVILSTKVLEMAAKAQVAALQKQHTKKSKWTPDEYDALTITIQGQKVPVGVYRMTDDGVLVLPDLQDTRRPQMRSKLRSIVNQMGGKLRDKDVAIVLIE